MFPLISNVQENKERTGHERHESYPESNDEHEHFVVPVPVAPFFGGELRPGKVEIRVPAELLTDSGQFCLVGGVGLGGEPTDDGEGVQGKPVVARSTHLLGRGRVVLAPGHTRGHGQAAPTQHRPHLQKI